MIRVLFPHVHVQVALSAKERSANLTLVLRCCFCVLLHDVHFETAVLGESSVAFWTLVGFFTCMTELVPFEVERICKAFGTDIAFEGPFYSV